MVCKNYQKSTQCAYNNAIQAVVSDGTTLEILGTQVCDTGISIDTGASGFTVERSGVYRFSFDAVFTAGATAGNVVLQLFNNTVALPCAYAIISVAANGITTLHAETVISLTSCCGVTPNISAQISGLAGTVNHVCANAIKLA